MTKVSESELKGRILASAIEEFHFHGIHGARMQRIADAANVSKSMLHYYYKSKEELFDVVFKETMAKIFPKVNAILNSDLNLFSKIAVFVTTYTDLLFEHYQSSTFILSELSNNKERVLLLMIDESKFDLSVFNKQVELEIKRGNMIQTDPRILFLNMISLTVFPFVGMPVHLKRLKMNENSYFHLLEKRKSNVIEMILNSIKK